MSRSVFDVFTGAMVRYARWFTLSVLPGAHTNAPLGFRRLGLVLLFPVFLALQLVHWVAFLVDELCFPGYRRVSIKEPVFIIGIPRSGTTYLHRELSANPRFTTVSTWEALLAPAVCERKLLGGIAGDRQGLWRTSASTYFAPIGCGQLRSRQHTPGSARRARGRLPASATRRRLFVSARCVSI